MCYEQRWTNSCLKDRSVHIAVTARHEHLREEYKKASTASRVRAVLINIFFPNLGKCGKRKIIIFAYFAALESELKVREKFQGSTR